MHFLLSKCYKETCTYIKKQDQDFLVSAVRHANLDIVCTLVAFGCCVGDLLTQVKQVDLANYLITKGARLNKMIETKKGRHTPLYKILSSSNLCKRTKDEIVQALLT